MDDLAPAETILNALDSHTDREPDKAAFYFLNKDQREVITFGQLQSRARSIAGELLRFAQPGDRALLTYPAGLQFVEAFLGCLYAGIIATPAYLPMGARNSDRIRAIAEDCAPRLLLQARATQASGAAFSSSAKMISICTDAIAGNSHSELPRITPDDLALLQYTSGSTAAPKGVKIRHGNLIANERAIALAFGHDQSSIVCGWLPAFHDMGLIGITLQPLFVGFTAILLSPLSFLAKPVHWLQAIDEFDVTTSGGPNFAYEHCLSQISEDQCQGLDLSRWKVAFSGSEPVRHSTLCRFSERFSKYGFQKRAFFPCYGLAEATLFVAGGPVDVEPRLALRDAHAPRGSGEPCAASAESKSVVVSCGKIASNLEVAIVSPATQRRMPEGCEGEIWVRGPNIASGYWSSSQDVGAFGCRLLDEGGRDDYLATGDLGFVEEGELFVTGRLKEMIIIRGVNIYPHDVEQAVESVLEARTSNAVAAFAVERGGTEELAVVAEAPRDWVMLARSLAAPGAESSAGQDACFRERLGKIRERVAAQFGVQIKYLAFLPPATLPRTTSGKVQRLLVRNALRSAALPFLALPGCVTSLGTESRAGA